MLITLLTDFGEGSPYIAQMKGVILGINPQVTIVDITHSIPPQQIDQAARIITQVQNAFSADTCHLTVVDPGVGSNRQILLARIASQYFIAPDNGVLSLLMREGPVEWIYSISKPQYWRAPVSTTFHGRDIMSPVAAHLSLGVTPDQLGSSADEYVSLAWDTPRVNRRQIEGAVATVDSFGNLITNIPRELLEGVPWDQVECVFEQTRLQGIKRTYADGPVGTLLALIGSGGYLELAEVNGNAARTLGAHAGDPISVEW